MQTFFTLFFTIISQLLFDSYELCTHHEYKIHMNRTKAVIYDILHVLITIVSLTGAIVSLSLKKRQTPGVYCYGGV